MNFFRLLYATFLDSLFPLSGPEKELFSMSAEQAFEILPRASKPPIEHAFSIFSYKDSRVTKLIWNIKYKKQKHAVAIGAFAIWKILAGSGFISGKRRCLIIPLPITEQRRRERGFNQCELLTEELARLDKSRLFEIRKDLLQRVQHKSHQTLKTRKERLKSAKGIFAVNEEVCPKELKWKETIIIDDVITTGSTMLEAMETLKKSGFENVKGLSLAH